MHFHEWEIREHEVTTTNGRKGGNGTNVNPGGRRGRVASPRQNIYQYNVSSPLKKDLRTSSRFTSSRKTSSRWTSSRLDIQPTGHPADWTSSRLDIQPTDIQPTRTSSRLGHPAKLDIQPVSRNSFFLADISETVALH